MRWVHSDLKAGGFFNKVGQLYGWNTFNSMLDTVLGSGV